MAPLIWTDATDVNLSPSAMAKIAAANFPKV
jgi:hypothetical protein